jgi:putative transposase
LKYKCHWYGSELVNAPRTFPSSKTCSRCGHKKKDLSLSEREYHCKECGMRINRDLNAALNLVAVGLPEAQNGCGEDIRLNCKYAISVGEQTSKKQEPNN